MSDKDIDTIGSLFIHMVFTTIGFAVIMAVSAAGVQYFWNTAVPAVFSLKSLSYGEAFSLVALCWLISYPKS